MILSFDAVFYTVIFLLPGYLTSKMLYVFSDDHHAPASENLLKYLCYSCLNNLAAYFIIYKRFVDKMYEKDEIGFILLVLLCFIVLPIGIGYLLIWCRRIFDGFRKNNKFNRFLYRLALWGKSRDDSALDYLFGRTESGRIAKIILQDGREITFEISTTALISESSKSGDDLYIDHIINIEYPSNNENKDKIFTTENIDGIWIPKRELKNIFIERKETKK